MGQYSEALQALKAALERSEGLERREEREIYVRCLRGMAEISNKLGRREEAVDTMQHVVDCTREAFGPDHAFTNRARMHLKSVQKGDLAAESTIPPMVYRLGRGEMQPNTSGRRDQAQRDSTPDGWDIQRGLRSVHASAKVAEMSAITSSQELSPPV